MTIFGYFKKPITLFLLGFVVVSAGAAFVFYRELQRLRRDVPAPAQAGAQQIVARVARLLVLPDETPTVATVSDPERLRDQPFFAKAKKGDKVLIYTNARKAILYDPVQNRIVEVAPLNLGVQGAPGVNP